MRYRNQAGKDGCPEARLLPYRHYLVIPSPTNHIPILSVYSYDYSSQTTVKQDYGFITVGAFVGDGIILFFLTGSLFRVVFRFWMKLYGATISNPHPV